MKKLWNIDWNWSWLGKVLRKHEYLKQASEKREFDTHPRHFLLQWVTQNDAALNIIFVDALVTHSETSIIFPDKCFSSWAIFGVWNHEGVKDENLSPSSEKLILIHDKPQGWLLKNHTCLWSGEFSSTWKAFFKENIKFKILAKS